MRQKEIAERISVPFDLPIRKNGIIEKICVFVSAITDITGEALFDEISFREIAQARAEATEVLGPVDFKQLRERLGLTQVQMGRLLLCGAKTYTRWETGRSLPNKMMSGLIRYRFQKELNRGYEHIYPIPAEIKIDESPPGLIKINMANSEPRQNALIPEGVLVY